MLLIGAVAVRIKTCLEMRMVRRLPLPYLNGEINSVTKENNHIRNSYHIQQICTFKGEETKEQEDNIEKVGKQNEKKGRVKQEEDGEKRKWRDKETERGRRW